MKCTLDVEQVNQRTKRYAEIIIFATIALIMTISPVCQGSIQSFESCLPTRQENKQWSGDQIKQTILSLSHLTKTSFVADMIDPRQTSFATFGYQVGKLARWNDRDLFVPPKQNVCSLICSLLTRTFYMFFFKWLNCLQSDIPLVSLYNTNIRYHIIENDLDDPWS